MDQDIRSDSPGDTNRQEQNSKTSFLIEDILYRGQRNTFKQPDPRRFDYEREPKYFPVTNEVRPVAREGSYLQVAMGALGAYLHTPSTYKAVETPYFLSQGKLKMSVDAMIMKMLESSWYWFTNDIKLREILTLLK